jgi:exodeoxyribonuclease V beta subunit
MDRLLCLKASAGSGKTFSLAKRYIALLYKGAHPSQILAVTFTNKAANEMKSRIVENLRDLEHKEDFLRALAEESGLSKKELLQRRQKILREFLSADIRIDTIDSFLQSIARKFAPYAGIDADFEIGEDEWEEIWSLFVRELGNKEFDDLVRLAREHKGTQSFFEDLYEKEKEFAHLLQSPPRHRFFEVYERIQQVLGQLRPLVEGCPKSKDMLSQPISKLAADSRLGTIRKKGTVNYGQSVFKKDGCPQLEKIDALMAELLELLELYLAERERFLKEMIFRFYTRYRDLKWRIKRDENYLEFKDVEHIVYELLRQREIDSDFLYFRLDGTISHILIDEFQDTSATQWKILEPLVREIAASNEGFRTFFYVGDTKQAIYRFRGGHSDLFDYVARSIPHMRVRSLDTNYRSKKEVVEFVNDVFGLQEKATKDGGYVELMINHPPKKPRSKKYEWRPNLAAAIKKLLDHGARPEDIAVLVHKNDTIIEVADLLKSEFGLSAVTSTRKKVIHQPKARAVIDLLKGLYHGEKGRLFMANFLSFIGRDPTENVDIAIDAPAKMIKKICDRFELWDPSTLKLLEHALGFATLVDFVHKIDDYGEELPNAAAFGINVLTIHKAKGLEFEHVVVVDENYRERPGQIIYDYEGIELKDLRINLAGLEEVDGSFKDALERERRNIRKDMKNREYVAYTRAKSSLFILKHPQNSSFLALEEKGFGEPFVRGRIEIERAHTPKEPAQKFTKRLQNVGPQEGKAPKEYKPNDYEAIYLGEAAHALFEMDGNDYALNHYGLYCDYERARKLYERGREYEPYRELLKRGKVYREFPFVHNGRWGYIDLLVVGEDEAVVVDYKSARPHDERPYIDQVRHYIEAAEALFGKKTRGYLYYLDTFDLKEVR